MSEPPLPVPYKTGEINPAGRGGGNGAVRPPPIFNLPPGVKRLIAFLVVVHVGQHLMPPWLDAKMEMALGYIPLRYWNVLHGQWGGPGIVIVATPLTYMFLHASWLHLGMNVLSLAAFGSAVERLAGPRFMVQMFIICGVIGAFTEFASVPRTPEIVIGASAGISGLFAVAFLSLAHQQNMSRLKIFFVTLMTLGVICVTGMAGVPGSAMPVAWISHVGGFLAGVVAEGVITRRTMQRPGWDISWYAAVMALPLFVVLLNVAR